MTSPLCVLWVEATPPAVHGMLKRWLIEPAAGMFVGRPSARVREHLWTLVGEHISDGRAVLVVTDSSELGAEVRMYGDHQRELVDLDGLVLVGLASL